MSRWIKKARRLGPSFAHVDRADRERDLDALLLVALVELLHKLVGDQILVHKFLDPRMTVKFMLKSLKVW